MSNPSPLHSVVTCHTTKRTSTENSRKYPQFRAFLLPIKNASLSSQPHPHSRTPMAGPSSTKKRKRVSPNDLIDPHTGNPSTVLAGPFTIPTQGIIHPSTPNQSVRPPFDLNTHNPGPYTPHHQFPNTGHPNQYIPGAIQHERPNTTHVKPNSPWHPVLGSHTPGAPQNGLANTSNSHQNYPQHGQPQPQTATYHPSLPPQSHPYLGQVCFHFHGTNVPTNLAHPSQHLSPPPQHGFPASQAPPLVIANFHYKRANPHLKPKSVSTYVFLVTTHQIAFTTEHLHTNSLPAVHDELGSSPNYRQPPPSTTATGAMSSHAPAILLEIDDNTQTFSCLEELSCVLNKHLNVIICLACKSVQSPDAVQKHAKGKHNITATNEHQPSLASVISQASPFSVPLTPVPLVFGLQPPPAAHYLICSTCRHGYSSFSSLKSHHCTAPAGSPLDYHLGPVQRISNNNNATYFEITTPAQPTPNGQSVQPAELFRLSVQELERAPDTVTGSSNWRNIHPLIVRERWIEHLTDIKIETITALVAPPPREDPLFHVSTHVLHFLTHWQQKTRDHWLLRLIGTRPMQENEAMKFAVRSHHPIQPASLFHYSKVVSRALILLIRNHTQPEPSYTFKNSKAINKAIAVYTQLLTNPEYSETLEVTGPKANPFILHPKPRMDTGRLPEIPTEEDQDAELQPQTETQLDQDTDNDQDQIEVTPPRDHIQRALTHLLQLLFTDHRRNDEYRSVFTRYLVLSSLASNGKWSTGTEITQKIAAINFTGRLTMASIVFSVMETQGTYSFDDAYDVSVKDILQGDTTMPNLYLLHRRIIAIKSADQGTRSLDSPDASGRAVYIGKETLQFSHLAHMLRALDDQISKELDELLFREPSFSLPLTQTVYDNTGSLEPNFGFMDDNRNPWHRSPYPDALQYLLKHPALFSKYAYIRDDQICWLRPPCITLRKSIYELQCKLLVAMHLTSGAPARGTELAAQLIRNLGCGTIRNVFITFNILFFRGSYNKSTSLTDADKTMIRVPLHSLGRSLIRFLVFLRPLYTALQSHLTPIASRQLMYDNSRHYLYAGLERPLDSEGIRNILGKYTSQYIHIRIITSCWRQIISHILKMHSLVFDEIRSQNQHQGLIAAQFGHDRSIAQSHYGQDTNTPTGFDIPSFLQFLRFCGVFHIILMDNTEILHKINTNYARQRAILFRIRSIEHPNSVSIPLPSNDTLSVVAATESIAQAVTHHLQPGLVATLSRLLAKCATTLATVFLPGEQFHQGITSSPVLYTRPRALKALREFLGDTNASFSTPLQAEVTEILWQNELNVLYVSPTGKLIIPSSLSTSHSMTLGSGKTIPGLLCSHSLDPPGKITLWILPLKPMVEQFQHVCERRGIAYHVWQGELSLDNPPPVILASIEVTEYMRFHTFLTTLHKRIIRVIIDEVHLLLSHSDFRPVMRSLRWLGTEGKQICLQTATLPPHLESALWNLLDVTTSVTKRAPTSRKDIAIRVEKHSPEALLPALTHTFNYIQMGLPNGKMIIFCNTVKETQNVAELLGVPCCYSALGLPAIKALLDDLRHGKIRAIAATCCIGVCIDIPGLVCTIHLGGPRNTLDYCQEIGRLARDSTAPRGWAITLLSSTPSPYPPPTTDICGVRMIRKCLEQTTYCRRLYLDTFMDGSALTCIMLGGQTELCDICLMQINAPFDSSPPQHIFPPELRSPELDLLLAHVDDQEQTASSIANYASAHHAKLSKNQQHTPDLEIEQLFLLLNHFSSLCIACWFADGDPYHNHSFENCRRFKYNEYIKWKHAIQLPQGTCFHCGIPQRLKYRDRLGQEHFLLPFQINPDPEYGYKCTSSFEHTVLPLACRYSFKYLQIILAIFHIALAHTCTPRKLATVCKKWETIVEGVINLHNAVYLSDDSDPSLKRARLWLQNSTHGALFICLQRITGPFVKSGFASLLYFYSQRLSTLSCNGSSNWLYPFIESILPQMTSLNTLALDITLADEDDRLDLSRSPHLVSLRLDGYWITIDGILSINLPVRILHLQIAGLGFVQQIAFQVLASCTTLQTCVFFMDEESRRISTPFPSLVLPSLVNLRVIGPRESYQDLLLPDAFPALQHLSVHEMVHVHHPYPECQIAAVSTATRPPPLSSLNLNLTHTAQLSILTALTSLQTLVSLHIAWHIYDYNPTPRILPTLQFLSHDILILTSLQDLVLYVSSAEVTNCTPVELHRYARLIFDPRPNMQQFLVFDTLTALHLPSRHAIEHYINAFPHTHPQHSLHHNKIPSWVQMLWPETYHPKEKDDHRHPHHSSLAQFQHIYPYVRYV
ncbi:hypothetical protein BDN72DRAFT_861097 [Pluteus cervinus]|uniref:Uncharacterized protein n=1 Tax=Pluteus cervinus TaxID=181527 RepID=A0ACD3AGJ2_9AGAR|nr:hypothetical protein BDN72DRAFT_861097 [Pluteus cervinus]